MPAKFSDILVVRTMDGRTRRLQSTPAHAYRIDNETAAGPLRRPLRLDQALAIVAAWDEDCNEGRAALVSADDAAVSALREHAAPVRSRIGN